jgi:uncharacterized protein YaaW (UPF0174 family)
MSTKRKDLTIKEKKDLLVRYDKLNKCSQREAALPLKIPQPTLNKILKNRKKIVVGTRRTKFAPFSKTKTKWTKCRCRRIFVTMVLTS